MRLSNSRIDYRLRLLPGAGGIAQTIRVMRQCVEFYKSHPRIIEVARNIVMLAPPKDQLAEVVAVFEYVRDQIRYVADPLDVETLTTPDRLIDEGAGDCDDKSTLLATLLAAIGIDSEFVVTGYTDNTNYEHVYVLAYVSSVRVALDPCELQPAGWQPPRPTIYTLERNL